MSSAAKVVHDPELETRERIRALVQTEGTARAAKLLGMPRQTTLAIAAGAEVRAGTLALAAQRVALLPEAV